MTPEPSLPAVITATGVLYESSFPVIPVLLVVLAVVAVVFLFRRARRGTRLHSDGV
jgi:hypothetical protein